MSKEERSESLIDFANALRNADDCGCPRRKRIERVRLKQHVPDPELWKFLKHSVLERLQQVDEVRARFLEAKQRASHLETIAH